LWPKQKTSYATIGTPIDVFFPLAITKYLNVYTNMHAYTQFLSFINFVTSKTIITCIQFSSCNHSGLVLGPGFFIQVNSGAVVYRPRHLGCEMSGFGPAVLSLLGLLLAASSLASGGEEERVCTGRLLGRCCCVLQREFDGVREKEGIRTNALLAVKRNEELSLFFLLWRIAAQYYLCEIVALSKQTRVRS
jgi:hypothetical protein